MFNIHGEWQIEVCGNVVVQNFSGGWNEEAVISYVKDFRIKTTHLSGQKWAILSVFENWELGVPEIAKHVEIHCKWFMDNGCVKDCHVYTPSVTKKMQLEKLVPHTDDRYERQVFSHIDHAVSWLANHRFLIENSEIINSISK
jgi:hypothetical protein